MSEKQNPDAYDPTGQSDATGLVRKASIEEKLGHRARAFELYARIPAMLLAAGDTLREAGRAAALACEGETTRSDVFPELEWTAKDLLDPERMEKRRKALRENLDRAMWHGLLISTGMASLMDAQARKEFERSLAENPPEVTRETVLATLEGLHKDAGVIFRRGLVNAFAALCRDYRSHDGFKIGPRIVIPYAFSTWKKFDRHGRACGTECGSFQRDDVIRDVDRVMHILDGETLRDDWNAGLCGAIRAYARDSRSGGVLETPYWRFRWYQNGNAHLWCLRDDLRTKANKLIAEHYGEVVGAGPDVAERNYWRPEQHHRETEAYYPTPPDVAEQMVVEAGIGPGMRVLEPQAGTGGIAKAILEAGVIPDCVEKDIGRACELRELLGPDARIICGDFFDQEPEPIYDRILMNPPFGSNAEMYHVLHALRFLKPGGRLVAIMPKDCEERRGSDGERIEVARAYNHHLDAFDASFEELPWRAFREVSISLVMVTMTRPVEMRAAA